MKPVRNAILAATLIATTARTGLFPLFIAFYLSFRIAFIDTNGFNAVITRIIF